MCGRTACTLGPDDICRSCGHMTAGGQWVQPQWRNPPGGHNYYPSYNLAPTAHSPVLLAKKHFQSESPREKSHDSGADCEWVIQPMYWGLIPSWHQGDPKSIQYKMNNARSDGMLSKRSFKVPLENGRRCVALSDGYFEWQTKSDGKKQPYFIYFPPDGVQSADKHVDVKTEVKHEGEHHKRLMTCAALYDTWRSPDGGDMLYSYSVITVDAHPSLAWLHDRMPAILNGEDEIRAWLDYSTVPLSKAVQLIRPVDCVTWHAVSTSVNDSRNKSADCVKAIDLSSTDTKKSSATSSFMKNWLASGKKRASESTDSEDVKKPKS